ncbi:hypothetical protein [Geitlerinema sp. PCC 9228]|jgi:hypothetical protein|uniref:DUF6930 domain-containing protein n=1 Tax=Geitlerinema sp. PCC 9228 TaxID=111611 RepID=UPI0008F99045|nr:hypothetical protein [Geitlerinema sp. PCC 9228]
MTLLTDTTRRRLQQLPQSPNVWEGDRRYISAQSYGSSRGDAVGGDCILWVDGAQGVVRSMEMVAPEVGHEAVVRSLIQAIESPQSPVSPTRPQKVVVKDRELHFFLRRVLQELDIAVEYVPNLPLIDEIFRSFSEALENIPPKVSPEYLEALEEKAGELWELAPWEILADHQILAIEMNKWGVETLYACILGMAGLDYGVVLYRSLDSIKQFRRKILSHSEREMPQLEEAFLEQDCWFLTYESQEEDEGTSEDDDGDLGDRPFSEIQATFGNLHPLEGLRSFLYEEEAIAVWVALEAFSRFCQAHYRHLSVDEMADLSSKYRLQLPQKEADTSGKPKTVSVKVSTLPQLAEELQDMAFEAAAEEEMGLFPENVPMVADDLIPEKSLVSLGDVPQEWIEQLQNTKKFHNQEQIDCSGQDLPVVLIQTTRPKAKEAIEQIQAAGGLRGVCFQKGEVLWEQEEYQLGILQTEDNRFHLFGEYAQSDRRHRQAKQNWDRRCQETNGICSVAIAMGLTGASRGQPQPKDIMGLFVVRAIDPDDAGLPTLRPHPVFRFEGTT